MLFSITAGILGMLLGYDNGYDPLVIIENVALICKF